MKYYRSILPLAGLLMIFGVLLPSISFATEFFTDNFEAYNPTTLSGQGNWDGQGAWAVVNYSIRHTGIQSINGTSHAGLYDDLTTTGTPETDGTGSFWFYIPSSNPTGEYRSIQISLQDSGSGGRCGNFGIISWDGTSTWKIFDSYAGILSELGIVSTDQWHLLTFIWHTGTPSTFTLSLDGGNPTSSINCVSNNVNVDFYRLSLQNGTTNNNFYIDDIGTETEIPVPTMEIVGVSPESETEITDLNTTLTIGYQNFDWELYNGFVVNFKDNKINAVANSKQFLSGDLDPSGTGEVEINLEDFNFDSNGQWYLTGLGFGSHLDIEGGMYLTTRGYIDFWTDELVFTPYYLTINVEGLPTPYIFTEPNDWYSSNVDRFDAPTAFFTSFIGLISPIFEKVGEFGVRAQSMFNQNEAYDRGYALGEVFPLINGYIQKIDLFFGGFPLASFFLYLILTMLAIFIIRAVMKFIPFFG